jgi:exodeoxyribonuclease VII large subunit
LRARVEQYHSSLKQDMLQNLVGWRSQVEHSRALLSRYSPRAVIDQRRQRLDELRGRLDIGQDHRLTLLRQRLAGVQAGLRTLGPLATLERGYAIVSRRDTGQIVRSVSQVQPRLGIEIRVGDGHFAGTVDAGAAENTKPGGQRPGAL